MQWHKLRNPVLSYRDYSIKDASMAYRAGVFHLFFSAFDQERSAVAHVTTRDFTEFSGFHFLVDGREAGFIGMCSPEITYADGRYVLVFNSWGGGQEIPNRLFYMESEDLERWSERRALGHELDPEGRIIDGALAPLPERWMCACKWWQKPRMATAPRLEGPWSWLQEEPLSLLTTEGSENGLLHENFQFLHIGGIWHLLSTDFTPHHPWLYRINGDPGDLQSWARWVGGYRLQVPPEEFNTHSRDNAAAILDLTGEDGFYYMVYGGRNEDRADEFTGAAAYSRPWARGWNKLGLARSRDLVTWRVPGA
jgi:hypothetical protein